MQKSTRILIRPVAEFPGEYRGASEAARRDAFRILEGLPDVPALRFVRGAAARRSCYELRSLASRDLLDSALVAPAGIDTPPAFALAGPIAGEETGYGPASLGLLGGFGLMLPEAPIREGEVGPTFGAERDWGAAGTPDSEAGATAAVQPGLAHNPANPFPGLRPFQPEEARLFFGRGVHTRALVSTLGRNRFLAVVGTSGSGKSSLVRAGLIPALQEGLLPGTGPHWRVTIFQPGGDPIGELARALSAPGVLGDTEGPQPQEDQLLQAALAEVTLRRSAFGLAEAVRQARMPDGDHLLVVVDQFEEVFRFQREAEDRQGSEDAAAFVKLLLEGSRAANLQIYVVLTMRSDYLGDCSRFRDLPETINDAQYLIPRLTREQRRETIVSPVRVAGASAAPRLVEQLLNDAGDDPDQLPILQHALMRTWDRWAAEASTGEPLDTLHYDAAGRMSAALSEHADEIFAELGSDRLRDVAGRLFKALTDKGEDGRGVRRGVRLDRLATAVETEPAELMSVIDAFRRPGRSFLMPPVGVALTPDVVVDISHESLMRIWARLSRWVAEEAESAKTYRRLAEIALLHRDRKARLWGDPDLTLALGWRENERPNASWARRYHPAFEAAMEFLDASDQAATQASRKRRTLALGGLGVTGGIAVLMFLLWARAQHGLNQVKAFADADRLDRLESQCPLLFAPQGLRDEDLAKDAVSRCAEALKAVPDLLAGLEDHRETLDALEKEGTRGSFQHYTVSRLVSFLKVAEGAPSLGRGGDPTADLKSLVEVTLALREFGAGKADCALLFAPQEVEIGQVKAEAGRCRNALPILAERLAAIQAGELEIARTLRARLGDLEHPLLDGFLSDMRLQLHFVSTRDTVALIARLVDGADPQAWKKAAGAVAASPRYGGLALEPLVGLVPLGPDPDSGLWEFAHVLSGEVPERGEDGRLTVGAETGVVLVLVPGGDFLMGSEQYPDEGPVHRVSVPPFLMAKHELTQGQIERLTGQNPSYFDGDDRRPAETVSFDDALAAAAAASLRLPSEAEWEYAARAGTEGRYWWCKKDESICDVVPDVANCSGCESAREPEGIGERMLPVGSFPANGFGLHDTAGNVWEWVEDCWHQNYTDAPTDGSAWLAVGGGNCGLRVLRGGSWYNVPEYLRSANRDRDDTGYRNLDIGFRLAQDL